jgi:agmatinase
MMSEFDPNAASLEDSGIFGLPFTEEQAKLVYVPIEWEVTTSYGGGTSEGPNAILAASRQVDLFDLDVEKPYEVGLAMGAAPGGVAEWNREGKALAMRVIEKGGRVKGDAALQRALDRVNQLSRQLNEAVYLRTKALLDVGKIPALVGGDHSVPLGAFRAVGERMGTFGVLHFDAHLDTRKAFEGFTYSHASIMFNALEEVPQISKLVQVGIRDFCEEEIVYCSERLDRVKIHFDSHLQERKFKGETWSDITQGIVNQLPNQVWISFDIDGLDPKYCPNTGTPVPGGLEYSEAIHLIAAVARSGRKIVGFDLNEVAPGEDGSEWDANVGSRLLYKLSAWTLLSQGLAKPRS